MYSDGLNRFKGNPRYTASSVDMSNFKGSSSQYTGTYNSGDVSLHLTGQNNERTKDFQA